MTNSELEMQFLDSEVKDGEILSILSHNWENRQKIADWFVTNQLEWNCETNDSLKTLIANEVEVEKFFEREVFMFFNSAILQKLN